MMKAVQAALITLACVLAAGCGRFGFGDVGGSDAAVTDAIVDARDGAPLGHDEDGDGIPDLSDPCPHLAGPATDTDGDGVGDACDPHPTVPGDRIVVFSALTPGDSPFDDLVGWEQEADAIRHAGINGGQHITLPLTSARVEVGFTILGIVGTMMDQHQIASGIDVTADPYYFTELNQNDMFTTRDVAITRYTMANGYVSLGSAPIPVVHTGTGLIRYDAHAGAGPSWSFDAGWAGEMYSVSATTPGYVGGTGIRFAFNGLDLELRYVLVISTP